MPGTGEVKRKIKSVKSTKKITRAMQMVSAVKMRKAQQAALASRTYTELAAQIITNIGSRIDLSTNPLLTTPKDAQKIGIILVSTNKGLVGGFNTALTGAMLEYIAENSSDATINHIADVIAFGKKGKDAVVRMHGGLSADFIKPERAIGITEIFPLAEFITKNFLAGAYKEVVVIYNKFITTLSQKPVVVKLLPFQLQNTNIHTSSKKNQNFEYLFEPNPITVLEKLLPRIIESTIYQAVLESDASEHSARMVMMKNATDAAGDLIDEFTLAYNQLRQANITRELAEIIAGMQ